ALSAVSVPNLVSLAAPLPPGSTRFPYTTLFRSGKVRAEQIGLRARKLLSANTPIIGALPRTSGGTPSLRPILPQAAELQPASARDRKSTRLNSSHLVISYAVFCLKKKKWRCGPR